MANQGGKKGSGCGAWIAGLILFAIVVTVIGKIAQGFTTVATSIQYGSAGLPDPTDRSAVYPLAWGLFFAVLITVGFMVAVVGYEYSRRQRFLKYVSGLTPPPEVRRIHS
jgi:hypothetical protein